MTPIEDRVELQDVMLRYAAGVDDRDMDLYQSCFAQDCEIVGFGDSIVHGSEAWRAYVEDALSKYGATQHMLGPQLATIDGDVAGQRFFGRFRLIQVAEEQNTFIERYISAFL